MYHAVPLYMTQMAVSSKGRAKINILLEETDGGETAAPC